MCEPLSFLEGFGAEMNKEADSKVDVPGWIREVILIELESGEEFMPTPERQEADPGSTEIDLTVGRTVPINF